MDDMAQGEQWRVLAEEAAQEKDPKKLMEIINALTHALDEKEAQKARAQTDHAQHVEAGNTSQSAAK
jgi:hypothetical protein